MANQTTPVTAQGISQGFVNATGTGTKPQADQNAGQLDAMKRRQGKSDSKPPVPNSYEVSDGS